MRISDWSSDVCSSDLLPQLRLLLPPLPVRRPARVRRQRAAHHGDAAPGYLPACRLAALSRARLPEQRNLDGDHHGRSEEHTSELQSLMRISYAVFCLKKKTNNTTIHHNIYVIIHHTRSNINLTLLT